VNDTLAGLSLTAIPLFRGLEEHDLRALVARAAVEDVPAGADLIVEGERGEALLVVLSGAVRVHVGKGESARALDDLGPGACIGEMSLVTEEPASATVTALTDCRALRVERHAFERALGELPVLGQNLGAILAQRLRLTSRRAIEQDGSLLPVIVPPGKIDVAQQFARHLARRLVHHCRRHVLLVDTASDELPSPLPDLAALSREPARFAEHERAALGREPGDQAILGRVPPGVAIDALLGDLCDSYRTVIALLPTTAPPLALLGHRIHRALVIGDASNAGEERAAVDAAARMTETSRVRLVRLVGEGNPSRRDEIELARSYGPATLHEAAIVRFGEPISDRSHVRIDQLAREVLGMRVGVALGSGGTRGFAHVGVLETLAAHAVPIDCIAGTSIGSVVASLWALGHAPDEIMSMLAETRKYLLRWTVPTRSLLSNRGIREHIGRSAAGRTFEDSPIALGIVAADIHDGARVSITSGELAPAILASSSIPGVFPAVEIGGRFLVDGGICEPVPTASVAELGGQLTIGVKLGAQREALGKKKPLGVLGAVLRTNDIMQGLVNDSTGVKAQILIAPELRATSLSLQEFELADEFRAAGRLAAEAALPRLRALMPWLGAA